MSGDRRGRNGEYLRAGANEVSYCVVEPASETEAHFVAWL